MTTERMAYFAEKYLLAKIDYWESAVEKVPNNAMAAAALEDYKQELQELQDMQLTGNLTKEGHW